MNKQELQKIKQKALEEHIPIIMDETLEVIEKYLKENKPKKILEIGTAVGYSAICFSKYLKENGRIDTIEKDEERAKIAIKNIKELNLQNKINVICGDAVEILKELEEKYDVIFIDASKSKYPIFLEYSLRLSHENSLIIADNVLYKGYVLGNYNKHKQRTAVTNLRKFLAQAKENKKLETKIMEVGDGLAIIHVKNNILF